MEIQLDTVYNCDSIELMREMLRNGIQADWLITDPPYGIGEDGLKKPQSGQTCRTHKVHPKKLG